jgi:hypothetical protein
MHPLAVMLRARKGLPFLSRLNEANIEMAVSMKIEQGSMFKKISR